MNHKTLDLSGLPSFYKSMPDTWMVFQFHPWSRFSQGLAEESLLHSPFLAGLQKAQLTSGITQTCHLFHKKVDLFLKVPLKCFGTCSFVWCGNV